MSKMNASRELCPGMTMSHNRNPAYFDPTTGVLICILNGLLAVPTTILNFLLIVSILSTPSLRKPSFVLICALAFTDFGVGILVQPLYIARKVSFLLSSFETYCFLLKTGNVAAHIIMCPSFFIVTAISVDRYLAIKLQNRYHTSLTNIHILEYLAFTMVCAGCVTYSRFQTTSPKYMSIAAALLCIFLSIIVYCYSKSLKGLRAIQVQVPRRRQDWSKKCSRHQRVLQTLVMIVTCLVFCYVPFVSVIITIAVYGRSKEFMIAWEVTLTLMYLNSFLNPILHFLRVKELQQACIAVLGKNNWLKDEHTEETTYIPGAFTIMNHATVDEREFVSKEP
ncbi:melanocyte-stimulating hormone receptor-like [Actinia tenebrosa]|uniref:Melanocyte-stimulating hormone receptor-like n=1 Tax=Actinia tenebrosa TaxID=6105 RepID=A0A6P8ICW8_ACTTE|nr:melanocyte-stimulating hormone receptor-like [Actinia tenebrosa]